MLVTQTLPVKNNFDKRKIIVNFSFISSVLLFGSCSDQNNNNRDFIISDCSKDTLIKVKNLRGNYVARNISLKVNGTINDSASISIGEDIDVDNSTINLRMGKGKVDFRGKGEIYAQNYRIVYLHQKATKGQLKIRLQLLSAAGDTLTDNE